MGISGAIWIDGDGDGHKTSAREYAMNLRAESKGGPIVLLSKLDRFDAAVSGACSLLLFESGTVSCRANSMA